MQQTSRGSWGALLLVVALALVLGVIFYVFPPWQVATDGPDKALHSGTSPVPVALMWLGSLVLGAVMIYGIMRTRHRSAAERVETERATQRLYQDEAKDEERSS